MSFGIAEGQGYLSDDELGPIGLRAAGRGVRISRHALLLAPQRIAIGDGSIIEPFVTLSPSEAGLRIGRGVIVEAYASILGQELVEIGDDVTLGMRCSVFSSNDDYSGATLLTPTVPDRFRGSVNGPVRIDRGAVLGEGSIVLPGIHIGEAAIVAPFSLVTRDVPPGAQVGGMPAKIVEPPAATATRESTAS
jgi:galactoside O-acetyltransferase